MTKHRRSPTPLSANDFTLLSAKQTKTHFEKMTQRREVKLKAIGGTNNRATTSGGSTQVKPTYS
jgi:hypothetical protein